jgi:hypothetical protein
VAEAVCQRVYCGLYADSIPYWSLCLPRNIRRAGFNGCNCKPLVLLDFQVVIKMLLYDSVAFTGSCFQLLAVGNSDFASGVFDKGFALQLGGCRTHGRSIRAQHIPKI